MSTDRADGLPLTERTIVRWKVDAAVVARDTLVIEEPLELRANQETLAVIMRTPGHDEELVRGLLNAEGIIRGSEPPAELACSPGKDNEVTLHLGAEILRERWAERKLLSSSACGVCGAAALAILDDLARPVRSDLCWTRAMISAVPLRLREQQAAFDRCGALHGAALFDAAGELLVCREDVGRHNAVDKVIGWALQKSLLPLSECVLGVSGRLSYEIVHKAIVAGIPILVAVSAPSSLAVDLAERWRVTLAGFVRDDGFNVYSHPARIASTNS